MSDYDLLVLGGGSAGLVAATTAARLGVRVGLIESERLGGDCTWTGCVPSKALIHAAAVSYAAATSPWISNAASSYPPVALYVRSAIAAVAARETPEDLATVGVDVVRGAARFQDRHTITVDGRTLSAPRLIVCTGASPAMPPVPGIEEIHALTYRTIFELECLPHRLIVLGGGPIGAELAQACARLGSEVTVLDQTDRLVPVADPDASALLAQVFSDEGIHLCLGAPVERVSRRGSQVVVEAGGAQFEGDAILVATGRQPNIAGLDLERAGIEVRNAAISVDRRLATTADGVYAAGDVTGGLQFTHYAGWQGYAAARNALLPGSENGVRDGIPWTVFTDPAVGQVGTTPGESSSRGRGLHEHRIDLSHVDRAETESAKRGFVKLYVAGKRLAGASIVSPHAGELINELSLAIESGARIGDLARAIHVYPTYGSAIQQLAGDASMDRAMSGVRGRITGWLVHRSVANSNPRPAGTAPGRS